MRLFDELNGDPTSSLTTSERRWLALFVTVLFACFILLTAAFAEKLPLYWKRIPEREPFDYNHWKLHEFKIRPEE